MTEVKEMMRIVKRLGVWVRGLGQGLVSRLFSIGDFFFIIAIYSSSSVVAIQMMKNFIKKK